MSDNTHTILDDETIDSLDDIAVQRELLRSQNRALEISEQTRFENAEGKQAQRVDTKNAAAERTIKAQFDYARTIGQVTTAIAKVGVGMAGQSASRLMNPAIAAIGGVFSLATGILEGSRVLTQSSSQLKNADEAMRQGEEAMSRQRPPSGPAGGAPI